MFSLPSYTLLGVFALLTAVLAGAAVARLCGLSSSEGAYLAVLLLVFIGWLAGRRERKHQRQS